ncbi:hypothetical protein QTP70_020713 [Hemibagrus guttatus]|uniref:Carboxylesterase type B domain-containing protein n=1 Tax=Hemibagrus guttatus TaxID=175788 RepID=A0AAE0VD03_9TELE|nr:hypothetical protein QTP70_020713 [Hemibagrus guttatus]
MSEVYEDSLGFLTVTYSGPVIVLKHGSVRGKYATVKGLDKVVEQYLSIPYAQPPVGPLRLAAPQPAEPWEGEVMPCIVLQRYWRCLQNPKSMKLESEFMAVNYTLTSVSEDCLYLNVYTPSQRLASEKLPVMLWIHGGGLKMGGALAYDGSALAAYENIIVVIIQYRLSILGFFRHFLQLFQRDPEAFPGQPSDIVSPACPGSSPGPFPGGACPEHLSLETSRRHPKQMPEPPQLPPFDVEEQRLYSELLPGDRAPYPISKGAPRHSTEEAHFGRLYLGSYPFGHDPELMTKRCVGGIEEILEVFLPPSDNIPSRGQQLSTSTVNSVGRELLTPSEAPNGLPEFPRGHPIVLLHGLTELLPDPSFCFRNHPGCSSLGLPVCLSCLRSPPSQPGSIGLLLQLDGIPYFQCPPLCLGIAAANGTRDLTPTAPDGCVNNGGGENGPEKKRVQPLSRSWVPEPRLCVEASPTISSRHRSTSLTSSGSFPPSEVTFHVPKARFFVQAYRPLVRHSKPVLKQVKTWPEGAISALQDCFECTDWDMFREAATNGDTTDLEEHTSSVTSYISKCIDDVTISKSITTRSNQKLWMTAKVCALLKSRDSAFRAGDKNALRTARAKLSRAIREAKCTHSQRIHGHFQSSGDTRCMWQGIQSITNYRPAPPACDSDASLPDVLNSFYAQFEAQNDVMARKTIPPPENQVLFHHSRHEEISMQS